MINVTVERRYGSATVKSRVTASSIDRAMELAGEGARLVFPIEPGTFFRAADTPGDVENLSGRVRMELAS